MRTMLSYMCQKKKYMRILMKSDDVLARSHGVGKIGEGQLGLAPFYQIKRTVTKLYVLLDSVTRLLSDRINVAVPYSAPTPFPPCHYPRGHFFMSSRDPSVVPVAFYRPTCSTGFSISFFLPSYCRFLDTSYNRIVQKVYMIRQ